jgi:hypothetical protein
MPRKIKILRYQPVNQVDVTRDKIPEVALKDRFNEAYVALTFLTALTFVYN